MAGLMDPSANQQQWGVGGVEGTPRLKEPLCGEVGPPFKPGPSYILAEDMEKVGGFSQRPK